RVPDRVERIGEARKGACPSLVFHFRQPFGGVVGSVFYVAIAGWQSRLRQIAGGIIDVAGCLSAAASAEASAVVVVGVRGCGSVWVAALEQLAGFIVGVRKAVAAAGNRCELVEGVVDVVDGARSVCHLSPVTVGVVAIRDGGGRVAKGD